ncbi:MAG: hypothetical protein JXR97_12560, partial [Planctomycetes bacterium]|nr:hypothetical protein [Planctomycetota bacterium]
EPNRYVQSWYGLNARSSQGGYYPTWGIATWGSQALAKLNHIIEPRSTVSIFDGVAPYNPSNSWRINARHNGQAMTNILFWDGHSSTVLTERLPMPSAYFYWSVANLNNLNCEIKWLVHQ